MLLSAVKAIRCPVVWLAMLAGASAADLAPESIGNSIREFVYTAGLEGSLPGPFSFILSKNGIYRPGFDEGTAMVWGATYSWEKTGPNTGIFRSPAGGNSTTDDVLFLTFTAPGRGAFSGPGGWPAGGFIFTPFELGGSAPVRNTSARITLTAGQTAMVGFVVGGTAARRVLIRAVGPTLAQFGVAVPSPAPSLSVFRAATPVASNTRWGGEPALAAAFAATGAFALPPASADSALLLTLEPGAYTAQVRDATGGEILVEVYFVN